MGLIVNQPLGAQFGASIVGAYISMVDNRISVVKTQYVDDLGATQTQFSITFSYSVYFNQAARTNGNMPITTQSLSSTYTGDITGLDLYGYCYSVIQQKYPNSTTDVFP